MKRSQEPIAGRSIARLAILILIIAIGIGLSYANFYGPSQLGDQYEYVMFGWRVHSGNAADLMYNGVLGQKLLLNYGIGFFFDLFGVNAFASTLFSEFCFIATLVIIYEIGKSLKNNTAGLISAFVFAVMPISQVYSAQVNDGMPLAFIAALSILMAVKATRSKTANSAFAFMALGSFFGTIGFLITAESLIILLPIFAIALYSLISKGSIEKGRHGLGLKRKSTMYALPFFIGIVVGLAAIMLWGHMLGGSYLSIIKTDGNWYSASIWRTTSYSEFSILSIYRGVLFPFYGSGIKSGATLFSYVLPSGSNSLPQPYENLFYAWFAYAAVAFAIAAVLKRNRAIILPLAWFVITLAYLSAGTMSLSHYTLIPPFARYTFIFTPALALLIGISIAGFYENNDAASKARSRKKAGSEKRKPYGMKKIAMTVLFVAVLAFLTFQSFYASTLVKNSARADIEPFIRAAQYINSVSPTYVLQSNYFIPIQIYTGFKYNYIDISNSTPACSEVNSSMLVVLKTNQSFQERCSLAEVAGPFTVPKINGSNLFEFDGIWTGFADGNVSVYKK